MRFDEFNLDEKLLEALSYMGFENASPIQEQAIPQILAGKDLIACAQTGTGKTAAFILPVLNKLTKTKSKGINTLVLCPTRELAIQIEQQIQGFSYFTGASSIAIYGGDDGSSWNDQKASLSEGIDIVVATPGKLIAHINMGYVNFRDIQHLILDEADRMLDMGFINDILKIISSMPKEKQCLFFSATMQPKIRDFANKILRDPFQISISISKPAAGVIQEAYLTYDNQKTRLIDALIHGKDQFESIIVFSSTKIKVNDIVNGLKRKGYSVHGISSDLEQKERENVLAQFRAKRVRILVATDVLSRGIDIKDINLVINYDVPNEAQDYVHRVGRTARASTTGVAITLINPDDMYKFHRIEQLIESIIPKLPLPADLGEGPEWDTRPKRKEHSGGGGKKPFKRR
ncbi:MAG: DEAD/DEAH box helicase [Bacteroidetes bacterium]|nr:DEAD/DEAH box helicase [Bacteroidota bacterium]